MSWWCVFQSHYRSDFNLDNLIWFRNQQDFNPIIGLILTLISEIIDYINYKFQSHYRSDFNFLNVYCNDWKNIFQSHYRSDFNIHLNYSNIFSVEFQSHYRSDFNNMKRKHCTTSKKFQSHYRSDFNYASLYTFLWGRCISIPL